MGLSPRIAIVEGDDVSALMPALRAEGVRDMGSGEPLPRGASCSITITRALSALMVVSPPKNQRCSPAPGS